MRADPSRDGLDFGTLEDPRPRPFLVILDADKLEIFSGWFERPDVVIDAIRRVVEAVRSGRKTVTQ